MTTTPNLNIDHIAASQAQKEVTANAAFDALDKALCSFTAIALEDADLTLTDEQALGCMALSFTGTLTANRMLTIPAYAKLLLAENNTDGGFLLSLQTPSGTVRALGNGQRKLFYCNGNDLVEVATASDAVPYDVGGTYNGAPASNAVLLRFPMPRAVRFKEGLSGSQGVAATVSTAAVSFSLQKNDTEFGAMDFAIATATATFTCTSDADFAAGDVLTVVAPSTPDDTLADLGFSLAGIRL